MLKTQEYTKLRCEHDKQFNESTIKEIYLRKALSDLLDRTIKEDKCEEFTKRFLKENAQKETVILDEEMLSHTPDIFTTHDLFISVDDFLNQIGNLEANTEINALDFWGRLPKNPANHMLDLRGRYLAIIANHLASRNIGFTSITSWPELAIRVRMH